MIEYSKYLNLPTKVIVILVGFFLLSQVVGEILEFKGEIVPEFMKLRKYFARKKREREILSQVPITLKNVQDTLDEFKCHYDTDNIQKRDEWIKSVNHKLEQNDKCIQELDKKLDRNNEDTLSLLIDNKRNAIINFASKVIDENTPVTREQFNRIFKIHKEYEEVIKSNQLTNGEVDIAFRIITEAYEVHMRNHSFIEDIRGYNVIPNVEN